MPGFLETQVANLLEKVLGPFVIGLDKQSLNLSVWSGEVLLRDLQLRTEALDALPIPVKAICGTVGEVRVTVPWRRLGKEPLIISIDRVFLLVGPRADTDVQRSRRGEILGHTFSCFCLFALCVL